MLFAVSFLNPSLAVIGSSTTMAPKLRYLRMDNDDLAWERGDEALEAWEKSLHKAETYRAIAGLIKKYRPGDAVELHVPIRGGYNVFWRLEYKDGSSAAMRIPSEGIDI